MVVYDAVIQQKRRHGHRISLTTPGCWDRKKKQLGHLPGDLCYSYWQ